jgi:hypothetical protein
MRGDGSKLAHERPQPEDERPSAEILQFRPRERLTDRLLADRPLADGPIADRPAVGGPVPGVGEPDLLDDLAEYEQDREEEDEVINYPHRMFMNVIAVVVVTMLIGVGVWLADTIAQMERDQDCVLQGRQNCAPIDVAAPVRK